MLTILLACLIAQPPPATQPADEEPGEVTFFPASRPAATQPAAAPLDLQALLDAGEAERVARIDALEAQLAALRGRHAQMDVTDTSGRRFRMRASREHIQSKSAELRRGLAFLEECRGRFLPTLELRVGSVGVFRWPRGLDDPPRPMYFDGVQRGSWIDHTASASIEQIVDGDLLIDYTVETWTTSAPLSRQRHLQRSLWLTGVSTDGLVDGDRVGLDGLWRVTATKTFRPSAFARPRTVLVLELLDIDLAALARPQPAPANKGKPNGR